MRISIITDLHRAAMLLTRIPLPPAPDGESDGGSESNGKETENLSNAYWCFGIIGACLAALPALMGAWLLALGMPPLVVAALIAGGIALLSGGLHHDGLADCADGLHGNTPEARLKIMRDSRIGSFGVLALIITTAIYITASAALASAAPAAMVAGVIAAAATSRALMGVVRFLHDPPPMIHGQSLAAATGRPDGAALAIGVLIALAISIALCGVMAGMAGFTAAIIIALATGYGMARRIGGANGDVLGAAQQLGEVAMLATIAAMMA